MNNINQSVVASCALFLALLLAGCSKDAPDSKAERKISKVITTETTRTLVEDVASGQVVSDVTETEVYSEDTFIWDGDFLARNERKIYGELLSSYVYSYADGLLVEVKDEADGQLMYFYYSDGHLDKIVSTTDPNVPQIFQLYYDEKGRVKSICESHSEKIVHELEFSGSNLSRETMLFYPSIESDEPNYYDIFNMTFSTAKNPLKGIYTCDFVLSLEEYFSENLHDGCVVILGGKTVADEHYEITTDNEYPTRLVLSNTDSDIKDGKRTTVESRIIVEYEYLTPSPI